MTAPAESGVAVELNAGQMAFMGLDVLIGAMYGGIGSGKTWIGARWHLHKALANPYSLGVVAGGVARTLNETTVPTLLAAADEFNVPYVYGHDPLPELGIRSYFKRHSNIITWPNGAQDMVWSLAAGERLRGPEVSRGWVDELRLGDKRVWDILLGRFRATPPDGKPQLRVTSTPSGLDWQYTFFIREPQERPELREQRATVHARTEDNWTLASHYVGMLLSTYDETYARQELGGEFIDLGQGMAYYAFNRERNVVDKLPAWWDNVGWWAWSLDFNVDPMTAIIGKHHKPTGEVYILDELFLRDSNTPAMCDAMAAWHKDHGGGRLVHVYGDASGAARSTAGKADYVTIRERFPSWPQRVPSSNPAVRDRLAAVNGKLHAADKGVRLRIHSHCRNLIEDLELCQRDDVGHPLQHANDADFERKKRTHITDALGYLIAREYPATHRTFNAA